MILGFVLACANDEPRPAAGEGSESESAGTESEGISGSGGQVIPTTGDDNDTIDPEESEDSIGFVVQPEVGSVTVTCNVWTQDCPRGEKCMPWANDGGGVWNGTRCTTVIASPGQPGDACTVEGSGTSGIDSCDVSSMCWNVDGASNQGTCVGFCEGSELSPVCPDPSTGCSISNDGVLILCLNRCDPLTQDCSDSEACYPEENGFFCSPDASGPDLGVYGDPCEFLNVCDAGLFCSDPATVPNCSGAQGCCSEFCDMAAPDVRCSGADDGQVCTAFFAEGEAPPGYEDVGICVIPQ